MAQHQLPELNWATVMPIDSYSDLLTLDRFSDYVYYWRDAAPENIAMRLEGAPEQSWTHRQFADDVDAFAKGLLAAGIVPGDRVALLSQPNPRFAIAFFATISIGAIFVGLNPKYQRGELSHIVTDSAPVVLLGCSHIAGRRYDQDIAALQSAATSIKSIVWLDSEPSLQSFLAEGRNVSDADLSLRQAAVMPRDPCVLVYTSGSTGAPKGALLHHQGFVETGLAQLRTGTPRPLRLQNYFPINHVGCLGDSMGVAVIAGGFTVYLEQFDPAVSLRLIKEHQLTLWGGVPTVFQLCLADPSFDPATLSSVELIFWGGAPCPRSVIEILANFCPLMATNYGMTEVVGALTLLSPTTDIDALANSVGYPSPLFEVRRQNDEGIVPADDEPAEVHARGAPIMLEYWNNPEATAKAMTSDGFYKTGDLATLNTDGSFRIAGRVSEMFKSGGYNVYPREVELALEAHPAVAMVAVVGIADELYTEVGYACVVPQAEVSADELRDHCRAILANYKVPKHFEITTNPPLLPIGKIDKKALASVALTKMRDEAV
jgi:acyl-CoA synthetase (AMP-forming)/AMP-acid ligase II